MSDFASRPLEPISFFFPLFIVIIVICATSRSNMFVSRSLLVCSLFCLSTRSKFCQFVLSKSESAKVILAPFRGPNFSPKVRSVCLQTSKRKVAKGAFLSSGTPEMPSFLFLWNFHT